MKAQDWADASNYRNRILAELMEYCVQHGLNSNATEKKMTIELPSVDEINVWPEIEKKKRYDVKGWGNVDVFGNQLGDDLPTIDKPLDEGTPPEEGN
jgi:hypothetical protein